MNGLGLKTTEEHKKYWSERKIDWKYHHLSTWNHPHRNMISAVLRTFDWHSLLEVGCGAGANLVNIVTKFQNKMLGGVDVSADALEVAKLAFKGGFFKQCSAEALMMSDNSTDVLLSDMTLIYIDPSKIDQVMEEFKRVARVRVILCEFHVPSWWERLKIRYKTGYNAYDYRKLLEKHGFHDVTLYKIPKDAWPGGLQEKCGYVISARVPRRK